MLKLASTLFKNSFKMSCKNFLAFMAVYTCIILYWKLRNTFFDFFLCCVQSFTAFYAHWSFVPVFWASFKKVDWLLAVNPLISYWVTNSCAFHILSFSCCVSYWTPQYRLIFYTSAFTARLASYHGLVSQQPSRVV